MKYALIIMVVLLVVMGCSSPRSPISPEVDHPEAIAQSASPSSQRWTWDSGLYHVTAD